MTELEQCEKYGRTTAELDSLINDSGVDLFLIESEFLQSAIAVKDAGQLSRLLNCAEYVASKQGSWP